VSSKRTGVSGGVVGSGVSGGVLDLVEFRLKLNLLDKCLCFECRVEDTFFCVKRVLSVGNQYGCIYKEQIYQNYRS